MSPSHLGEVKGRGTGKLEELTSVEDEEVAAVANHQRIGFGGIERRSRVVRGDLYDLSEWDNRQCEATVKNGQNCTHLTTPQRTGTLHVQPSPFEISLALAPLRTRRVDVIS